MDLRYFKFIQDEKLKKFYKNRPEFDLNRAVYKCTNCGTLLQSIHRHDWVSCICFENKLGNKGGYVDGGTDYTRIGGNLVTIDISKELLPLQGINKEK